MRRPKKPVLTPSKLTTYLACPTRYLWTYVDSRGHWYRKERRQFSFGISLHAAIEQFHRDAEVGVPTTDQVAVALEENWVDAGYESPEEMAEAFGEGQAILERYVDDMRALPKTGKTLFLEKTIHLDFDRFRLTGRVDRVEDHGKDGLEIVDYKSGREHVDPDDVKLSLAMGCYAVLLKTIHPELPVAATIWALKTGARATYRFTDAEISEIRSDLEKLGNEILNRPDQPQEATPKRLCNSCEFLPLCSRQPAFKAAYQPPSEETA